MQDWNLIELWLGVIMGAVGKGETRVQETVNQRCLHGCFLMMS